jgi:hypothetical protein
VQCLGEMPWKAGRLRSSPTRVNLVRFVLKSIGAYAGGHDRYSGSVYIGRMRKLFIFVPLFALLALALWFAAAAWLRFSGGDIPFYGYVAIAGGVLVSLGLGGGLMALVFYSNRHGYDDGQGTFGDGD